MLAIRLPAVDFLTITTFSQHIGNGWRLSLFAESMGELIRLRQKKEGRHLQYAGWWIPCEGGKIFWGEATQGRRKNPHWLLMVTGRLADEFVNGAMSDYLHNGDSRIKCTRIDLQVTEKNLKAMGEGGLSLGFLRHVFHEVEVSGKYPPSWIQDSGKESAIGTVGVGKRVNATYRRIYAKPVGGGHAIRFEVEYKREKSTAVLAAILNSGDEKRKKVGAILRYELGRIGAKSLEGLLIDALPENGERVVGVVETGQGNTEQWLMAVVLPSFERFIATSERGDYVARAFFDAMERGEEDYERLGQWRDSDIMGSIECQKEEAVGTEEPAFSI